MHLQQHQSKRMLKAHSAHAVETVAIAANDDASASMRNTRLSTTILTNTIATVLTVTIMTVIIATASINNNNHAIIDANKMEHFNYLLSTHENIKNRFFATNVFQVHGNYTALFLKL